MTATMVSKKESERIRLKNTRADKPTRTAPPEAPKTLLDELEVRYGSYLPQFVVEDQSLRPDDVRVYSVILSLAAENMERYKRKYRLDRYFPGMLKSQKTVAERAGTTPKNVRKAYKNLTEAGLIKEEDRGANTTKIIYMIGDYYDIASPYEGSSFADEVEEEIYYRARFLREMGHTYSASKQHAQDPFYIKIADSAREVAVYTPKEEDITTIARFYDSKARHRVNTPHYNSLSYKNPTQHKNYKYYEKLQLLCHREGWDVKRYIEFIFDHTQSFWARDARTGKKRFPRPMQMMGKKLIKAYAIEVHKADERYRLTARGVERAPLETISYNDELRNDIESSIKTVAYYVDRQRTRIAAGQASGEGAESLEAIKTLYIAQNVTALSPAYLYTIRWFREQLFDAILASDPEDEKMQNIALTFEHIEKSKRYQETVNATAFVLESRYNLPASVDPTELVQ